MPERGHDLILKTDDMEILLQVTELKDYEFITKMTQEEFDFGVRQASYQKYSDERPYKIDVTKMNDALMNSIRRKIDLKYSKVMGRELWLLVFTTFTLYQTSSEPLKIARKYLSTIQDIVFDEIWFSCLLTNPIRIWPE